MIKKFECLPSLNQKNVVTLSNIDMNNNVSDVGSNIDDSKKEELEEVWIHIFFGEVNEEDDSNTLMEKVSDEPIWKAAELLNGRL